MVFHLLHRQCGSQIQLPKWCPKCETRLESAEQFQKVYGVAKGQYVLPEETDFQALPLKTLKTVEVVEFVKPRFIDPRVYDKPYYLAPDEAGGMV